MKFIQYKNGSCDLKFSLKERIIILLRGRVFFSEEALKHFGNNLVHMVMQFNERLKPEINKKTTHTNEVKTK
jgi:aromatic ring-opening dioxygenase LigB subunit